MKPKQVTSELRQAVQGLRPYVVRATWFSLIASLLVLEWSRSQVMHAAGEALDRKLHRRVYDAMFKGAVRRVAGTSVQPMQDLRKLCEFVGSPAVLAIMEAPIALVMMVLLFLISPVLGWTAVAFGLLQMGVTWLNEKRTKPPLMEANQAAMAAQQYADNTLRNSEVIAAMGMLGNTHRRWLQKQRNFLQLQAKASESAGGFQALAKFLQHVLSSMLLGLACWLLLHNELHGGAGMMVISSILGGRMLAPLVQVVTQWQTVVNARDAWNRLEALLAAVPDEPPSMALPAPKGELRVEQVVAVAPGTQSTLLRNVAFGLRAGDVLAVVGPSASGKTTLARLLVGLWPANMGKVRLDGADIYAWPKEELGKHMGYLPQNVDLFEGTLAENIARFGEVDMAKVQAAAQAVGLQSLVAGLPQGFDTPVGPGGARLSGGQKQRVGLARALYGDPVFVVLDEPNASLDEEGDDALCAAVQKASQRGATVVLITHRTGALKVSNKMLVLRDGQQQAFGPRDQVLAAMNQANQQAAAPAVAAKPAAAGVTAATPKPLAAATAPKLAG